MSLKELTEVNAANLVGRRFSCHCGRTHQSGVKDVIIGGGALAKAPGLIKKHGFVRPLVVCDANTHAAAGEELMKHLTSARINYNYLQIGDEGLRPDLAAVRHLMVSQPFRTDAIIAVGSGTINDLCKHVSHKLGIKYMSVATAPSMDGYASPIAALVVNGMKTAVAAHPPIAILADTDILANAPHELIAAGFSSLVGRCSCLSDWRISGLINGEYYCDTVAQMLAACVRGCIRLAQDIAAHSPEAIALLVDALICSGIAMSFIGSTRCASGSEHHLAHFWEMRQLVRGNTSTLHGFRVCVGTVMALSLYDMLRKASVNFDHAQSMASQFDHAKWHSQIKQIYGTASTDVLEMVIRTGVYTKTHSRHKEIQKKWNAIMEVVSDAADLLPELESVLGSVGAPTRPEQIGIDMESTRGALLYAKDMSDRYTILWLLWDLGLLKQFTGGICDYFSAGSSRKCRGLDYVKLFVLDMDGTIYFGNELFPFAKSALEKITGAGKEFVFFTNNSSENGDAYVQKLQAMGIATDRSKMLTSNDVIINHLLTHYPGASVYVVGTDYLINDFINAGIRLESENPDLAVLGFDTSLTYDKLARLCAVVRNGALFFAVNMDYNCPTAGGFIPDCGAIAAAVTASTGIAPEFFGKPTPIALDYIIEKTGVNEDEICFVGDCIYTDIAITQGTCALSALVLTGESTEASAAQSDVTPDLVLGSLSDLADMLGGASE